MIDDRRSKSIIGIDNMGGNSFLTAVNESNELHEDEI
jgi:hypothetical protein